MSPGGNLKFIIIGKGFIFPKHKEAIEKIGGEIVEVVEELSGQDAWKDVIRKTQADYIVILTPNNLHFEMVKFSAENGKMVLCEKPLALKLEEARILTGYPNIFIVYQLRHHPVIKKLKSEIYKAEQACCGAGKKDGNYKIEMDISVYRDEAYWKSWKGMADSSGGILFNLGIHYFDLLLYLFGEPIEISTQLLTEKIGEGTIKGKNYLCNWRISAEAPQDGQRRIFKINGVNYGFSSKENLHLHVYKDLLEKKGITPEEALKSIELIEKINENFKK